MDKIDCETLYEKYTDISPYNFIIKNNKVYIIDFSTMHIGVIKIVK